jgi:predicted Zn finger-like uncharacterized protein
MKIECPSCHLTGNINELELPPTGRQVNCPRCKASFQVAKPPPGSGVRHLMNSCPSCQYATFTEEMFAVCPKCGMTAENFQLLSRRQREREQDQRNQEALNRSFRNPDLVQASPEEKTAEPARAAQSIEVAAWLCIALGAALFCYGMTGIVHYYSKDWQAVLSEPVLEPVSKLFVFCSLGLTPWLATLFSIYFTWAAHCFSRLGEGSLQRLSGAAWAGVVVAVIYQAVAFFEWARVSSSTPSFSYYAVGILSSLFMSALLGSPFFLLLWYLRSDVVSREFKRARALSGKQSAFLPQR